MSKATSRNTTNRPQQLSFWFGEPGVGVGFRRVERDGGNVFAPLVPAPNHWTGGAAVAVPSEARELEMA
jgi:hypothetical protein